MTAWHAIGFALAAYLLLLARSAWAQGEMRQFLVSLGILAALVGTVAGVVWGYVYLDTH